MRAQRDPKPVGLRVKLAPLAMADYRSQISEFEICHLRSRRARDRDRKSICEHEQLKLKASRGHSPYGITNFKFHIENLRSAIFHCERSEDPVTYEAQAH
jgi:hypothetical protein